MQRWVTQRNGLVGTFIADHRFMKLQQMGKPSYAQAAATAVKSWDKSREGRELK
jgi:hypothetical protein